MLADNMVISLVSWQSVLGKLKSIIKLLIYIFTKKRLSEATFFLGLENFNRLKVFNL